MAPAVPPLFIVLWILQLLDVAAATIAHAPTPASAVPVVPHNVSIAVLQLALTRHPSGRLQAVLDGARTASESGAVVAVLPEAYLAPSFEDTIRAAARRLQIAVLATFAPTPGDATPTSRALLVGPDGATALAYERPAEGTGTHFATASLRTPGGGSVAVAVALGNDVHFPEPFRVAMVRGAHVVLVPGAAPPGEDVQRALRVRSYENVLVTVWAAPAGPSGAGGSVAYDATPRPGAPMWSPPATLLRAGGAERVRVVTWDQTRLLAARRSTLNGDAVRHPHAYRLLCDAAARPPPRAAAATPTAAAGAGAPRQGLDGEQRGRAEASLGRQRRVAEGAEAQGRPSDRSGTAGPAPRGRDAATLRRPTGAPDRPAAALEARPEGADLLVRVALAQPRPSGSGWFDGNGTVSGNAAAAEAALRRAAALGADVAVLPELWSVGYGWGGLWPRPGPDALQWGRFYALAEGLDGPLVARFAALARELRLAVALPLLRAAPGGGPPYNSVVLLDAGGAVAQAYDKVHTVVASAMEAATAAGGGFRVGQVRARRGRGPALTVGFGICMDGGFMETGRGNALLGAEVLLQPKGFFTGPMERDMIRQHAADNAMHWAMADYPAPVFNGGSFAADHRGRPLPGVPMPPDPAVQVVVFNLTASRLFRASPRGQALLTPAPQPALCNFTRGGQWGVEVAWGRVTSGAV